MIMLIGPLFPQCEDVMFAQQQASIQTDAIFNKALNLVITEQHLKLTPITPPNLQILFHPRIMLHLAHRYLHIGNQLKVFELGFRQLLVHELSVFA